jgi:cytochrome d ubiquinol oxidase subunit II
MINTIGPVWDGNEVWLITAGAATFAAFPTTYALMFSYLYSVVLLILFSLIFRGAAIEFREKVDGAGWKKGWDIALSVGSFFTSVLFGIAVGNVFEGLPMDASGYHGTLLSLLNPYGLFAGLLFLLLFLLHGSLWLTLKTPETLNERAAGMANKLWYILLCAAAGFVVYTGFATDLYAHYLDNYILGVVPALAALSLACIKYFVTRRQYASAFYSSCLTIVMVALTGLIGLYPDLLPSSIDAGYSLTIFNSSSSAYTLKIMTIVVLIFLPVVIACQIWIYKVFRRKITTDDRAEQGISYR